MEKVGLSLMQATQFLKMKMKKLKSLKMVISNLILEIFKVSITILILISAQFFPDLNELDDLDICPSLKNFEFSSDKLMDLPFLKLQSDHNDAEELDEYLLA